MTSRVGSLARLTASQVPVGADVLVPVGGLCWHGPHLPPDADTQLAAAIAESAAALSPSAVVGPPVWYGADIPAPAASGAINSPASNLSVTDSSAADRSATDRSPIDRSVGISVRGSLLTDLLVDYGRSVASWAGRVVLVNGRGGNTAAIREAVHQLRADGISVAWWLAEPPVADPHGGRVETSLLLHLQPTAVRLAALTPPTSVPSASTPSASTPSASTHPTSTLPGPTGSATDGRSIDLRPIRPFPAGSDADDYAPASPGQRRAGAQLTGTRLTSTQLASRATATLTNPDSADRDATDRDTPDSSAITRAGAAPDSQSPLPHPFAGAISATAAEGQEWLNRLADTLATALTTWHPDPTDHLT